MGPWQAQDGAPPPLPLSPQSLLRAAFVLVIAAAALLDADLTRTSMHALGGGHLASPSADPAVAPQPRARNACIVAQYDEDVSWAFDLASGDSAGGPAWDVVIYSKVPSIAARLGQEIAAQGLGSAASVVRLDENWGGEALPYLLYIVDHYEALPPHVLFLHGDPLAHSPYIRDMAACLNPLFVGYFALGGVFLQNREIDSVMELFRLRLNEECAKAGIDFSLPKLRSVTVYAAAQFIVSRSTIRLKPLAFWRALLRTVLGVREELPSDAALHEAGLRRKQSAFWLEILWAGLFLPGFSEEWRSYNQTCGLPASASTPLLAACCESAEHEAYYAMLMSPVVHKVSGAETWSRHAGH